MLRSPAEGSRGGAPASGHERSIQGWLSVAVIAVLLAACGTEDPQDLSIDLDDRQAPVAVAEFDGVNRVHPVTVDAERVAQAYVGAVDEDLFVAAVLDDAQDEITVCLCDGTSIEDMTISDWRTGEVRDGGTLPAGIVRFLFADVKTSDRCSTIAALAA